LETFLRVSKCLQANSWQSSIQSITASNAENGKGVLPRYYRTVTTTVLTRLTYWINNLREWILITGIVKECI
jgi:hypothetical protein